MGRVFEMKIAQAMLFAVAGAGLALPGAALADVKAGVHAWSRGDYAAAVSEWRDPAERGDADAQFNMAQAYRLGRGVERDQDQAELFYARAAAQGHIKAADNYGLMLFQAGRRDEALPYVLSAAERGDPRAQYLLGIAHFNGDLVEKDWVRAYALVTLANSAGLPQAGPAMVQMDGYIPLEQREAAQALAQDMKRDSDATRTQQLAAADLAMGGGASTVANAPIYTAPAPVVAAPAMPAPRPGPTAIARAEALPSVVAAQAAIEEASRVTGTQSPAEAGADYARPPSAPAPSVPPLAAVEPTPAPMASSTPAASSDGPWRVQLGAFAVRGNADRLWGELSGAAALAGKDRYLVPAGRLTKLQAGGFGSRAAAQAACDALAKTGKACLVTR